MYKNLNSSLKAIYEFLNSSTNTKERESVANWMLTNALSAKGYNNFYNFDVSGEQYFIDNVLKKINPRVCVDIGANIGDYTKALLTSTNALVIAFEPLDKPFEILMNIKNEFKDRLIIENKGVGAIDETLDILFNDKDAAHASFSIEAQNVPYLQSTSYLANRKSKNVEVISLDSYFSKNTHSVDFIKIDTEGFESEVLVGAKNIIKAHKVKAIQIEFNWHQLFRGHTLLSFAEMLPGYTTFQLLSQGCIQRDPRDPYCNIYAYSNFVFIENNFLKAI